jgi:hypothetical protein
MDHVAETSRPATMLSTRSKERLKLLLAVVPYFARAGFQGYSASKKLSGAREFWTKVTTPCMFMDSAAECNPALLCSRYDRLLEEVLDGLQMIVQGNDPDKVFPYIFYDPTKLNLSGILEVPISST